MVDATFEEQIDDFLEHAGVKGMRWGHRKAGVSGGSGGSGGSHGPKKTGGFYNNPSVAKVLVLGSYGKKSSYTNPQALAMRRKAGKLRIASMIAVAGSSAVSTLGKGNGGATAVAGILSAAGSVTGFMGAVNGVKGAHLEEMSRNNR